MNEKDPLTERIQQQIKKDEEFSLKHQSELEELEKQLSQKVSKAIEESKKRINLQITNRDAFRLMEYRCNTCNRSEFIWNGRNGVSPFGVSCRSCGNSATHIHFERDQFRPDFIPSKGMRYFTDFTKERALEVAKQKIEQIKKYRTLHGMSWDAKLIGDSIEYQEYLLEIITELMQGDCSMDLVEAE